MAFLHSANVVHGDLTPSNVLLASSAKDARHFVAKARIAAGRRRGGGARAAPAGAELPARARALAASRARPAARPAPASAPSLPPTSPATSPLGLHRWQALGRASLPTQVTHD